MIRPFMSSAESCTTETVVSAAWPAASRCMQTERMLRTRRSASLLGLLLDLADPPGGVVPGIVLDLLEEHLLRPGRRQPADSLQLLRELPALPLHGQAHVRQLRLPLSQGLLAPHELGDGIGGPPRWTPAAAEPWRGGTLGVGSASAGWTSRLVRA